MSVPQLDAGNWKISLLPKLKVCALVASCTVLSSCELMESKENLAAMVGGLGGYQLGKAVGKLVGYEQELKVFGALAGAYFGKEFGRRLDERDRAEMAKTTQLALMSGRDASWKNAENSTSGQARIVETKTKPEPIKVKILKSQVRQVPPLDMIGSNYLAVKGANVREGPSTDYVVVGSLAPEQAVRVVGKVRDRNWYLIAEGGVGSGFVYQNLLTLAPAAEINESGAVSNSSDVEELQVASERICRSIENTVTMPDGSSEKKTITACQGPDGWEVQPVPS